MVGQTLPHCRQLKRIPLSQFRFKSTCAIRLKSTFDPFDKAAVNNPSVILVYICSPIQGSQVLAIEPLLINARAPRIVIPNHRLSSLHEQAQA
jgi:hypothetical protein